MNRLVVPAFLAAVVGLTGCRTTTAAVADEPQPEGTATSSWFVAPDANNERLYPPTEGPTDGPTPGVEWEEGPFPHDMQPTGAGRLYLLELYQQTIDDKEALEREIGGLTQALDRAYAELEGHKGELELARTSKVDIESEARRLQEENSDLAARLATAQIRRLEAEKMLLEAKIEWAQFLAKEESGLMGDRSASPAASSTRR